MNGSEVGLPQKAQRPGKFLVCFARKARDQIRRNQTVGEGCPQKLLRMQKLLRGISAAHALQRLIASALQRKMEMRTEACAFGKRFAEALVHRTRLKRAQMDAHRTCGSCKRLRKRDDVGPVRQVASVRGDFDACNDAFTAAAVPQTDRLPQSLLERHGAHMPAGIGDDAVGAVIVAAVLHLQQCAGMSLQLACGEAFKGLAVSVRGHFVAAVPLHAILDGGQKISAVPRAPYDIGAQCAGRIRIALRHAAAYREKYMRVFASGTPDGLPALPVCLAGHRAGVDYKHIGRLVRQLVPMCLNQGLHGLRIELIGFAAECKERKLHVICLEFLFIDENFMCILKT